MNHRKRGIKSTMMDDRRECDDKRDKRCLSADSENGVFDRFVRVSPSMKALERSQGFVGQEGVYGPEHGPAERRVHFLPVTSASIVARPRPVRLIPPSLRWAKPLIIKSSMVRAVIPACRGSVPLARRAWRTLRRLGFVATRSLELFEGTSGQYFNLDTTAGAIQGTDSPTTEIPGQKTAA
jgi:hypothetical protein